MSQPDKITAIQRHDPDEHWVSPWVICVVPEGIDPANVIEKLKKQDQTTQMWLGRARKFSDGWMEGNPSPDFDRTQLKERKKWPSGLRKEEITDEMRAERQAITDYNQKLYDAHGKLMDAWHERRKAALEEWIAERQPPDGLLERIRNNEFYRPDYRYQVMHIPVWQENSNEEGI